MPQQSKNVHRCVIEFGDGIYTTKLVHPESGCVPASVCAGCGRDAADTESKGCDDCKDGFGPDDCWVQGWFDNLMPEEMLRGSVEIAFEPEWDGDGLIAHIREASVA